MSQSPDKILRTTKVFGIGFHKTGTSSLGEALETLGYRVSDGFGIREENIADSALEIALERAKHFDAVQDNPWPLFFRELDEHFPGSKFVLTIRDTDSWLRSVCKHFGNEETPMRAWIYGSGKPLGTEARYVEVYEAHNAAVRAHFADRPEDLLVLDIPGGDGWEELCSFLDAPIPEVPFFHSNRAHRRGWLPQRVSRWFGRSRASKGTPAVESANQASR